MLARALGHQSPEFPEHWKGPPQRKPSKQRKTSLYRHFDPSGRLLYVGVSYSVMARLHEHRRSPWFYDVVRVEIQHFDSRKEAEKAELAAIVNENPIHNRRPKVDRR